MAMIWSHFSTGKSSIGETNWMPALLTRMSTLPKVFSPGAPSPRSRLRLGHVGRRIDRLDSELGLEPSPFLLDVVRLAEAVDQYICALLCERPGNG